MASITGLHLQYRLWIAEMNADINVLRIFDDYLSEITEKNPDLNEVSNYKNQFTGLRKEMDDLRHEMHLNKMNLAALAKNPDPSITDIEVTINHKEISARYTAFRKKFDETKTALQKFAESF